MLKKISFILFVLMAVCSYGYSQTVVVDPMAQSKETQKIEKKRLELIQKHVDDSLRKADWVRKPTIGIGPGIFHFFGDVNHNKSVNPMIPSYGFGLNVSQNLNPSFRVDFDFVMGSLVANERSAERSLNFKSRVINGSVQATYNFAGMLKPDKILNPYISVGVGILNFDSKGDINAANGLPYYYWSDGSIRNVAQTSPLAETAVNVDRDYKYETDLRQQNLDGIGKYSQVALTIPVSFGFEFIVTERMKLKLGSTYYYSFTDNIDNVSSSGSGVRKGNNSKDSYLFTSFGIHYDFFTPKKKISEGIYEAISFAGVVEFDSDRDGIPEDIDKCPDTPKGAAVDKTGCPVDTDADGIPDYADLEPATAAGMKVDAEGKAITDDVITKTYVDTTGTIRAKMFEIFPDMRKIYPLPPPPPPDTKDLKAVIKRLESGQVNDKAVIAGNTNMEQVDLNKDKKISDVEVHKLIEDFLDNKSKFTFDEVHEIIKYLFEQ